MIAQPLSSKVPRGSWGRLIGTVLLMLAVIGVVVYGGFAAGIAAGIMKPVDNRVAIFLAGSGLGELAAFGVLAWLLRRRGWSLHDIGLGKPTNRRAIALGVGIALVYIAYTGLNPRVGPHLLEFSWLKLLAIAVALIAGLVEETIFRGYLMTAVGRLGYGLWVQVLLSGLLFSLAHIYAFAAPLSLLVVQGVTFLLGLALALTYAIGQRSLTPVIISHALIDLVIEPWLLLSFFQ